jgi:hypothetical protein
VVLRSFPSSYKGCRKDTHLRGRTWLENGNLILNPSD